ncbi:helix-turn-helix transcriptional regulator [Limimaricola pyoseonensis]|uniref:LuxR family transcriptional regulator n=1 Tax=Limimaricola pyoseonensis TaxID=521013 RepID=A0A1G7JED4_9RHOB|nr:autoinducer binding domain-containing protein [Limimaricola pyoseonensis]SDF23307.1 LuxR family transcriptional regulator [Limimaricola pyoseonensis]
MIGYSQVRDEIERLAPAGHYIALGMAEGAPGFEAIALPQDWTTLYNREGFMPDDPALRWIRNAAGTRRWSELARQDPRGVIRSGWAYGLRYGVVVSIHGGGPQQRRSYAAFCRRDREFSDREVARLHSLMQKLHVALVPPVPLTQAEIEVLSRIKSGWRLKQVAFELGVTEGAIKQRLRNARAKLGVATGAQAATRASDLGLI